jgi:hypothetical protein
MHVLQYLSVLDGLCYAVLLVVMYYSFKSIERKARRAERGRLATDLIDRGKQAENRDLLNVVYGKLAVDLVDDRLGRNDVADDEIRKYVSLAVRVQISLNLQRQSVATRSTFLHNVCVVFGNAISAGAEGGDYLPRLLAQVEGGAGGDAKLAEPSKN